MKVNYRCNYCGLEFEWETSGMYLSPDCKHCGSDDLKSIRRNIVKGDIFGYEQDSPMDDAWIKKIKGE